MQNLIYWKLHQVLFIQLPKIFTFFLKLGAFVAFLTMSLQINALVLGDTYQNSVGMRFIAIPAGDFLMGAGDNIPDAYKSEKPQHNVTISKPFYIGQFEVTQAEWIELMGSSPYLLPRSNSFYNLPGMKERITKPNHPATVSWNDAQTFIQTLNRKEGHQRYRLPTEAEWEYAARAGKTTAYSFSDSINELDKYV